MDKCKKKYLILVTSNSSWWKRKKFRVDSALKLKKERKRGWKILKKIPMSSCDNIDTRVLHKYILIKTKSKN